MKTQLYTLYDRRARETIGPITPALNDVTPIRELQRTMKAGNNLIADHPEDFDLLCIGELESSSGQLTAANEIRIVSTAADNLPRPTISR